MSGFGIPADWRDQEDMDTLTQVWREARDAETRKRAWAEINRRKNQEERAFWGPINRKFLGGKSDGFRKEED